MRHRFHPITISHSDEDGWTLVELMAVVLIVSILAMIVTPNYRDYLIRGTIVEARTTLATKRVQLEQFFQDSRTYIGAPACTADSASSQFFDFSCPVQTATTYTIRALGKSRAAGFTYTLDQNNIKATPAVPTGWSRNNPDNCWVTRKGSPPC